MIMLTPCKIEDDFIKKVLEILSSKPKEWEKYSSSEKGINTIITMEYNELMNSNSLEDKKHSLIHLASACVSLWRKLNNA